MANFNPYKIICEVLKQHPNIDMLIVKPSLYVYLSKDKLMDAKKSGLRTDEQNQLHAYFTRIPENLKKYSDYLETHSPIKIMVSKLKKIKDQKVQVKPFNIKGVEARLSEDDITKIMKKNSYFFDYFNRGEELEHIPHAIIWLEKGILPSFAFKIIDVD